MGTIRRAFRTAVPLVLTTLVATAAGAQTTFTATLTNGAENAGLGVSPTNSITGAARTSSGFATFVLNAAQTQLEFNATVFGLDFTGSQSADVNDNVAAAHIHAGSVVPPGNNGVVWGFFGSPFNDNNPATPQPAGAIADCVPLVGQLGATCHGIWDAAEGNGTTLTAQLANLFAGNAYINFHTTQFPGGEIRGQIVATPEPATLALLGTGLVGLGLVARRRRA